MEDIKTQYIADETDSKDVIRQFRSGYNIYLLRDSEGEKIGSYMSLERAKAEQLKVPEPTDIYMHWVHSWGIGEGKRAE